VELIEWDGYVSSALLGVEAIRACGRYGKAYAFEARSYLGDVTLLPLDDGVLDEAASVGPSALRSLDAVHLATALSIREEIGVFVTYDRRLGRVAEDNGLPVVTPMLSSG